MNNIDINSVLLTPHSLHPSACRVEAANCMFLTFDIESAQGDGGQVGGGG